MRDTATIQWQNGSFVIAGELNFKTVALLWEKSLPLIDQHSSIQFDLSKVEVSNSAGLALILAWIRYAKQCRKSILFHHIPTQLHSIIAVSGVGQLLSTYSNGEGQRHVPVS